MTSILLSVTVFPPASIIIWKISPANAPQIYAKKGCHPVIRHPFPALIKEKSPEIGAFLQKDGVQLQLNEGLLYVAFFIYQPTISRGICLSNTSCSPVAFDFCDKYHSNLLNFMDNLGHT